MLRILMGILAISYLSEPALSQVPQGFSNIKKDFDANMKTYEKICQDKNSNMTKESIRKLLQNVIQSSSDLHNLDRSIPVKCGDMLRQLYIDSQLEPELQSSIEDLCHSIKIVDQFFEESKEIDISGSFDNQTFQTFAHELLWGDLNLPDSLEDLYRLFDSSMFGSGLLSQIQERSLQVYQEDCDAQVSTQQQILYIYLQLVIAELKGLITTQQIYLTKRLFNENSGTYIAEIRYAEKNYASRLENYHQLFTQLVDLFPKYIRRCDLEKPNRGVNIIELERFSRFTFLDQVLHRNFSCMSCPSGAQMKNISASTNTTMYNCKSIGPIVAACPADPGSPRDYMWWTDSNGALYGRKTTCASENLRPSFPQTCALCACSTDQNKTQPDDNSTIYRISVTAQISDLKNNMIVTGVKFVTEDNAVHLQIRQANFTHNGIVHTDGGWKPLNHMLYDKGLTQTEGPMSYETLRYDRKSICLDDITAPTGMAITGVKFGLEGHDSFKIQIFVSEYDIETGYVFPFGNTWIDASTNPMRPKDYERKRIEINLDNSDDPTNAAHFEYDLESNKQIKFTHTDISKDAGQTTIPLLDAQPVETEPPFALGGFGLSYRGSNDSSGYVALRIYTMDIADYMYSLHNVSVHQIDTTRNPFARDIDYNL